MMSTPSHLSEEHSCDSAGSLQTTDFLYSLEKLSTHRGANTQQLRTRENKLLEGCAVGPLRNKTSREKGKKNLMCPRCKLQVQCPPKNKNQRHNSVLYTYTCTHAHTYTHALTQLKTRLPSVGNSSNKRNRSKLLLNLFDSIYFLFWPIVVQENISILNLVMYCRVSSIGKKHRGIASFIASVQTKVMEIFFFFSFPFLLQEYIGDHCFP